APPPRLIGLRKRPPSGKPSLDPFKPYLNQRRDEGITDASVLQPSCKPGTGGGARGGDAATGGRSARRPAALDAGEQAQLTAILARCPHPGALAGHNLAEYAEKTVAAHRGCLRETA